jgi:uncharacterized membrane protein
LNGGLVRGAALAIEVGEGTADSGTCGCDTRSLVGESACMKQTINFNFWVSLTAHVGMALATERQPACAETAVAKLIAMTEAVNFIAARSIWQRMWMFGVFVQGFAVLRFC